MCCQASGHVLVRPCINGSDAHGFFILDTGEPHLRINSIVYMNIPIDRGTVSVMSCDSCP